MVLEIMKVFMVVVKMQSKKQIITMEIQIQTVMNLKVKMYQQRVNI